MWASMEVQPVAPPTGLISADLGILLPVVSQPYCVLSAVLEKGKIEEMRLRTMNSFTAPHSKMTLQL